MFYVESDDDRHHSVRVKMCELQLSIIETDEQALSHAIDALRALAPPFDTLWCAASRLRPGVSPRTVHCAAAVTHEHSRELLCGKPPWSPQISTRLQVATFCLFVIAEYPGLADQVLIHALRRVKTMNGKNGSINALHIAQAGRTLLDSAQGDSDRMQTLELMLEVARRPCMAGCYPELEAHYICAKAFNFAASHMRSRNTELAQSCMTLASELADATNCKAVTSDMCCAAAKKFTMTSAEA